MLTPKHHEILIHLTRGHQGPIDGRSLRALQRRRLVNQHGHATTAGWHAIGELRYVPEVVVPADWEVETWRGIYMTVDEGPEVNWVEDEDRTWHIANQVEYIFDVYPMMRFYQACKRAESEWLASQWRQSDDREWEQEMRHGWKGQSTPWRNRAIILARQEAARHVEDKWNVNYTGDYWYRWAGDLYSNLEIGRSHRIIDSSYKYSLQDNLDELAPFLINPNDAPQDIHHYAYVCIT